VSFGAEGRMREQRDLRLHAEIADLLGGKQCHVGQLLGARVVVDIGVADEDGALRQHQQVHRVIAIEAVLGADHALHVFAMRFVAPEGAADQPVGVTERTISEPYSVARRRTSRRA
jgi:hypothetical protein